MAVQNPYSPNDGPLKPEDSPIVRLIRKEKDPDKRYNIVITSEEGKLTYHTVANVTTGMETVFRDLSGFWDILVEGQGTVGWFKTEWAQCGFVAGRASAAGLVANRCAGGNGTALHATS